MSIQCELREIDFCGTEAVPGILFYCNCLFFQGYTQWQSREAEVPGLKGRERGEIHGERQTALNVPQLYGPQHAESRPP